jgi:hypothetical protein
MKTKIDFNSSKNQDIKSKFVQREVVHCASQMMYELNNSDQFRDEILELFYSTQDFDQAKENFVYNMSKSKLKELCKEYNVKNVNDIDSEVLCSDKDLEPDYIEPYEFWIVSDWLGEKLKEHGQIVAEFMGFTIWGRLTTGQAILLDYVISQICSDMEILEGQKNQW